LNHSAGGLLASESGLAHYYQLSTFFYRKPRKKLFPALGDNPQQNQIATKQSNEDANPIARRVKD
jgi:hypothetical protein